MQATKSCGQNPWIELVHLLDKSNIFTLTMKTFYTTLIIIVLEIVE
jgi:hypothetical protein